MYGTSSNPSSNPQRMFNPTGNFQQYPQLSSDGTQSQPFNPQMNTPNQMSKRMATQTPATYGSVSQPVYMPQGSPQMDQNIFMDMGQSNGQMANQNTGYPNFTGSNGMTMGSPSTIANPSIQQNMQAQMMHAHMRQQQQQRMLQQNFNINPQMNPNTPNTSTMGHVPSNSSVSPTPNARPAGRGSNNPDQFVKTLQDFMAKRGTPIASMYPTIGDRSVPLVALYANVMRLGGSRAVNAGGHWQTIANTMNINVEQNSRVVDHLIQLFATNLAPYEEAWSRSQNERKAMMQKNPNLQAHPQYSQGIMGKPPITSVHSQTPSSGNHVEQSIASRASSTDLGLSSITNMSQSIVQAKSIQNNLPSHDDSTVSSNQAVAISTAHRDSQHNFKPKIRGLDTYGGVEVRTLSAIGADVVHLRPTIPMYGELGIIDIQSLTLSLKSGLRAEIRLALDTLITISVESQWSLSLKSCEDLVDTLVDVAQDEVDFLVSHAEEASDISEIPSYQTIVGGCLRESSGLVPAPHVGTTEYELDRSVNRLVGVTTVLRNLSFFESNHGPLADGDVIRFIAETSTTLGRRRKLFRTDCNTLDVMKDFVIFLSNLSQTVTLNSEQETLSLLELLLAFAPDNHFVGSDHQELFFIPYQPSVHRYLPAAIDSLAKLLARDEPNRALFKMVFNNTFNGTSTSNLLTRAFNLAIAPVPNSDNAKAMAPQVIEARRPYLEQGLLAANILCDMLPESSSSMALSWLSSEDGFAISLLKFVCIMSPQQGTNTRHTQARNASNANADDTFPFSRIANRGMMVLRKLASRVQKMENTVSKTDAMMISGPGQSFEYNSSTAIIPPANFPRKEALLGALLTSQVDAGTVRQLYLFASVVDDQSSEEE